MFLNSSLIQSTNIVLMLAGFNTDNRKFMIWKDTDEVLSGLEVARVSVDDSTKLFEHPLENGITITDHEIFNPSTVNIQAYIANDDSSTLSNLENYYLSGTILKIRAANKIIDKAVISSKPFELSSSVFDKTLYNISFKEIVMVTPSYVGMSKALLPSNSSSVNSGVKQAHETAKNNSWLLSLFSGD